MVEKFNDKVAKKGNFSKQMNLCKRSNIGKQLAYGPSTFSGVKNKKQGILWAIAATVLSVATIVFALVTVVGAALAVSTLATGAGTVLGIVQLINTATSLVVLLGLGVFTYNCVRNAHHHFSGNKIEVTRELKMEIR
ncbi:hypothetical protein PHSC3_001245 [Chlamydiales bacterium STE3]|nr:hypothetical protein PHSC3_001245 [Chlamydiales bacterium STE3]